MCLNHKVSPPHFPSTTSDISIFITILLDGTSIYYALKGRLASRYVHVTRRDIEVVTDIHCFLKLCLNIDSNNFSYRYGIISGWSLIVRKLVGPLPVTNAMVQCHHVYFLEGACYQSGSQSPNQSNSLCFWHQHYCFPGPELEQS